MKIPKTPPNDKSVLMEGFNDLKVIDAFFETVQKIETHGDYLHWDKLRFKVPKTILSKEQYWLAVKNKRQATRKILPFLPIKSNEEKLHFTRPDCVYSKLRKLDIQTGGIVGSKNLSVSQSDAVKYLRRSLLEEPFSSSVLEGAVTTRVRARELIESGKPPKTRDDRMVMNNYKAMSFIKQHINEDLTPELIFECQNIITDGTLIRPEMSGRFRDSNDIIVGDDYGQVFHVPPDYNELANRIDAICKFANATNDDEAPFIHPIVRAIILHFMLSYDHPFVDGNGRTARALFYWSVLKSGYWMMEYVSISSAINKAQTKYGLAFLYTETDENDLTYFILHQLNTIEDAIYDLHEYMERQRKKYLQLEKLLSDENLNHRQTTLLNDLFRNRSIDITIAEYASLNGTGKLTARKDLEKLTDEKWLRKMKKGRQNIYLKGKRINSLTDLGL